MAMKKLMEGRCMCRELPPHSVGLECFKAGGVYRFQYLMHRSKGRDILVFRVYPDQHNSQSSFCKEYETFGPQTFMDFFTQLYHDPVVLDDELKKRKFEPVCKLHAKHVRRLMPVGTLDRHPSEEALVAPVPCGYNKDRVVIYRERGDAYEILFMSTIEQIFIRTRENNGVKRSSVA